MKKEKQEYKEIYKEKIENKIEFHKIQIKLLKNRYKEYNL